MPLGGTNTVTNRAGQRGIMEDDSFVFMTPNPVLELLDGIADDALDAIKPILSPTPSEIRHDSDTARVSSESADETRLLIAEAARHDKPPVKGFGHVMNAQNQRDVEMIEAALGVLSEYFDCVTIFANRHEGDGTEHLAAGRGNFYARIGQVKEWLIQEEHKSRLEVECSIMEDEE